MQERNQAQQKERRSGQDRRAHPEVLEFPFVDSHGHLVTEERRKEDRRTIQSVTENMSASTSS